MDGVAGVAGLCSQTDEVCQGEPVDERHRFLELPQPDEDLEGGQREEQLGLGPVIDIDRIPGELPLLDRLLLSRMHLDGDRLARREDLEQEGQPTTELVGDLTQGPRRICGDEVEQGGMGAIDQPCWSSLVRTHPQL